MQGKLVNHLKMLCYEEILVNLMVFQKIETSVTNYDTWRPGYEGHADVRKSYSCIGTKVYTAPRDKNKITLVIEWSDAGKMEEFGNSDELKEAMKKSGSTGPPDVAVSDTNNFDVSGLDFQFETAN